MGGGVVVVQLLRMRAARSDARSWRFFEIQLWITISKSARLRDEPVFSRELGQLFEQLIQQYRPKKTLISATNERFPANCVNFFNNYFNITTSKTR